jgi:hypothetical protein
MRGSDGIGDVSLRGLWIASRALPMPVARYRVSPFCCFRRRRWKADALIGLIPTRGHLFFFQMEFNGGASAVQAQRVHFFLKISFFKRARRKI